MERTGKCSAAAGRLRPSDAVALVWWALSFWYERLIFVEGSAAQHPVAWVCLKLALLAALVVLLRFFVRGVKAWRTDDAAAGTLRCALPLLCALLLLWVGGRFWPLQPSDQRNILDAALRYETMGGFFFYLTMWIPMLGLSLFPHEAAAVVFKILLISLGAGYCVYRLRRLYGTRLAYLLYLPFLLPPGLYLSVSIHRLPSYAVLYLVFAVRLLCDRAEGRSLTRGDYVLLCLAAALLTQWRSEGIYLLVLAPILFFLAYRPRLDRRQTALALAVFLAAQVLVRIPQSVVSDEAAGERAMPLFEMLISGMERKGLDKEKNAEDLAAVDRYIDLEALHALNEELGDYCYNDNLILYYGMRPNPSPEDVEGFRAAVIRIVLRNPLVYLRNQLACWVHISEQPYHDRKLDELANIFQRLYLPTLWIFAVWLLTLRRRDWLAWFLTSGHICHMAITTALLPAAYFKYYYSEYLYAFLTATAAICLLVRRHREKAAAAAAAG